MNPIIKKYDRMIGRYIWGNPNGLAFNFRGLRDRLSAANPTQILNAQAHNLAKACRANGYAPVPESYAPDLMARIRAQYDAAISSPTASTDGTLEGSGLVRTIVMAQETIPATRELLRPDIVSAIEAYYGGSFRVIQLAVWRIYGPTPEQLAQYSEIFSERWHIDLASTAMFKLFINLSDVWPDDGPFHILPISETAKYVRAGKPIRGKQPRYINELDANPEVIRAVGPSGTALYGNTAVCLHRAGVPKIGHWRDMIQFQFMPSKVPTAEKWWRDIEPTVAERRFIDRFGTPKV